ncbi:MAG TPA: hypothetical protein VF784_00335 [Anaerolineales bacterium]
MNETDICSSTNINAPLATPTASGCTFDHPKAASGWSTPAT